MYESKEKEIDGYKVTVTQWPARKALTTKLRLFRILGPGLSELLGGFKGNATDVLNTDINMEKFSPAIEKLLSGLDETMFLSIVCIMMSNVRVNDMEMKDENAFNVQFAGKLEVFYKIVWFVLEVNYGSFFGESGIGKLKGIVEKMTPSQPMPLQDSQKI